jgi:hypothetical protein
MLTRILAEEKRFNTARRIRRKAHLLSGLGVTYSRNSRSASKKLRVSGPHSVEARLWFPLAGKIGLLSEHPLKEQSRFIQVLGMDFRHDCNISELLPRKAKPPECPQIGDTQLNGDTLQGRPVIRSPEALHVHPALRELGCMDVVLELNDAERVRHHATRPILINSEGTILSGLGCWRSALLQGEREIQCVEYVLGNEDSLQFILVHHRPQRGWNAFIRTRLALTLEPHFQRGAIDNMRDGGRHKGTANLPNLQHVDVRRRIAEIAGVGARNVSNVKIILNAAHSRLLTALDNGALTINKAIALCKLPLADQLEAFAQLIEDRAINKVIRLTLTRKRHQEPSPDAASMLAAFQSCESRHPGSVVVRRGRSGRTTISVSNELLDKIDQLKELYLHETPRSAQKVTVTDPSPLGPG